MTELINIIQIQEKHIKDERYIEFTRQAINLYLKIFSDPPYYEHFEFNDIEKEFYQYINDGCFLLAITNNETVGFMCSSTGLDHVSHEIETKMRVNGINYKKDIYISELGVSSEHRNKGIAKKLMDSFMIINQGKNLFLRTGRYNNDHVIRLYEKYDFKKTSIFEDVMNQRVNGDLDMDERFYMTKIQKAPYFYRENTDGYSSGSEHLYGTHGYYNKESDTQDDKQNDDSGYGSGSEYMYG